jgi:dUTP diphosphatase
MEETQLLVKLLSDSAQCPKAGSEGAAGMDLYADKELTIDPNGKALVPLNISIKVPWGYYGRIAPRSSLAYKHHIDVGAGVVDSDYMGPVGVVLFNLSPDTPFKVNVGDRVAQLILERISVPTITVVSEFQYSTKRGEGGFGSTGK